MQQIFDDVPAIYGFSSVAPLGPIGGPDPRPLLPSGGASEVGSGRASARLARPQFTAPFAGRRPAA